MTLRDTIAADKDLFLDTTFGFAQTTTWTHNAVPLSVRAVFEFGEPLAGDGTVAVESPQLQATTHVDEVPGIEAGDTFTYDGDTYRVAGKPLADSTGQWLNVLLVKT